MNDKRDMNDMPDMNDTHTTDKTDKTEVFLSQLKEVASSGDEKSFSDIIAAAVSSNISLESNLTEQGSTILMILAAMGRHDLISVLLKDPACPAVDQTNNNGTTALVFACSMNHFSAVKLLCEAGANVNWAIGSLDTPVIVAAEEGFDDIVSYLCKTHLADMELKNEFGRSALHCACAQGHLSTTTLLLDCGANLEATDNYQATPLVIACANGFVDIARLLLQRGACTTSISEAILTMQCDKEETNGDTINDIKVALIALLSSYAWVPALDLQRSCQQNDVTNAKRLLTVYPQLSAAVYVKNSGTQHLSEGGEDTHLKLKSVVYGGGASPLMVACLHNSLKVVEYLIIQYPVEHNATVAAAGGVNMIDGDHLIEARSEDGRTCLFYAAWSGALPVLQYLVHRSVVVGATASSCHQKQLDYLNARNSQGRSALYYACHNGHLECVAFLLASGADKEGILPAEIAEMPMRYSAFQTKNNNADTMGNTLSTSSISCSEGTTSDTDNLGAVSGSTVINTVENPKTDIGNNQAKNEECKRIEEVAAIEKVRASITSLLFGK